MNTPNLFKDFYGITTKYVSVKVNCGNVIFGSQKTLWKRETFLWLLASLLKIKKKLFNQ